MDDVAAPDEPVVFGAPANDAARVTAELRAVAARHGVELAPVSANDAAAAAAAASLWAAVTGTTTLSEVPLSGDAASSALARIVMRAAGTPVPHRPPVPTVCHSDTVIAAAERAAALLVTADDPYAAAVCAADDLGDDVAALAASATALLAAAVALDE